MVDIEREQSEYDEVCAANADLRRQHQEQLKRLEELKTDAATLQVDVERERTAFEQLRAEHLADLERKQRRLQIYQDLLGLSIDTVKGTSYMVILIAGRECLAVYV